MSRKRRFWRHPKWTKAHRWVTLAVGIQLVFWVASGAVFVFNDIDNVHGDFEFEKPKAVALDVQALEPRARAALRTLEKALGRGVAATTVATTRRLGRTVFAVYENDSRTAAGFVDAETGEPSPSLTEEQARAAALAHYKGEASVRSVQKLTEAPTEYRGKPLPVYRVDFDDRKETTFYVSPETGRIVTRRNWNWRLFDWFWMLHTMDYWGRDDFNHWWIRLAAVFAVFAVGSGVVLLGQRFLPRRD